ncbi:MAG TPA: hypothetical protein PLZ37_06480 [Nitrospira sp.]|nr:hypothetical protein [Nitrospira sp.]
MADRGFSHANFGTQARIEQRGKEVRLIFVAGTHAQAASLCDSILEQMKAGAINITMMGKPTSVEEV